MYNKLIIAPIHTGIIHSPFPFIEHPPELFCYTIALLSFRKSIRNNSFFSEWAE